MDDDKRWLLFLSDGSEESTEQMTQALLEEIRKSRERQARARECGDARPAASHE